ncbi:alpha/beta fold hydrolase [Tsukamurella soli]|uniref:Alpha/beta fold hydrolase n=1 Tax=Tsukamurella soli TaxID=644556 RepID=A0ABP8K8B4_9ACTN
MTTRIESYRRAGWTFRVRDTGPIDGPVVVLLHGFPQTSSSWAAVAALLNDRGVRTVAPDQRGYSPEARPRGRFAYRSSELTADIVALLGAIGRPVHLVGHDWGSRVAWAVAAERPDLVATLTAVSVPHPAAFVRSMLHSDQAVRSYYMAMFQPPLLPELLIRNRPDIFYGLLGRSGMTPEMIDTVRREIVDTGALTGALNWYRGLPFSTPTDLRAVVSVPTTQVWSDGDTALARAGAELSRDYVTGRYRLEVLAGASHWIPDERAADLADIICDTAGFTTEAR